MEMNNNNESIHGTWKGRWTFILAATGSAVGLGNIWKFPYMAGDNGGGAFVLVYLACICFIGIPIMIAEITIGRRGRSSPVNTMKRLSLASDARSSWTLLGVAGALSGLLILSFYGVAAGWAIAYIFSGFDYKDSESAFNAWEIFLADPLKLIFWHTIFSILTIAIVAKGVIKGLEVWISKLMPLLFILLVILCLYSMQSGAFYQGLTYLFQPDFTKINGSVVLAALGQAFFTLSLGMGAIMAYGAYMPSNQSIVYTAFSVAALDTLVALLAGIAIFPIVFSNDLSPSGGPGLVFQTLPLAFSSMPMGSLFGIIFFILLSIAALSSSISLLEPSVAWFVESWKMKRLSAAILLGSFAWTLGIFSALSFNLMSEFHILGLSFFDFTDFLTNQIMLPLGGIFIAIFVGWIMKKEHVMDEIGITDNFGFQAWKFILRYIAPLLVTLVFIGYFF